jgi:hypothetical protein
VSASILQCVIMSATSLWSPVVRPKCDVPLISNSRIGDYANCMACREWMKM